MAKGVSIDRLKADLFALHSPPLGSLATWKIYRQILEELEAHAGVKTVQDITPIALAEWVRSCPKNRANAWKLLSALRHACNYAHLQGWLKVSPFAFRPMERWITGEEEELDSPKIRHHGLEDLTRVMNGLRAEAESSWHAHRLFALAFTTLMTGARAREVQASKREDYDLGTGWFKVRANERRRLKTKRSKRDVPMPAELVSTLSRWFPESASEWAFPGQERVGPWLGGDSGFKPLDKLKKAGLRYGLTGLTFQSLRHSYITHCEAWGIPELIIQRLSGHTRPETTRGYRGFDAENLRRAIAPICLNLAPTG
jgi:integrase